MVEARPVLADRIAVFPGRALAANRHAVDDGQLVGGVGIGATRRDPRVAAGRLPIPQMIRAHDKRYTRATLLLAKDDHPMNVPERLGHTNIGTTLNCYSHVTLGTQRPAGAALTRRSTPPARRVSRPDDKVVTKRGDEGEIPTMLRGFLSHGAG